MSKIVAFASELDQRGFTLVPNALLLDDALSAQARQTWAILAYYARESDAAWPGQERLGEHIGVSDRQARTYVRELEAAGWLSTTRRGLGKSNLYRLHAPSGLEGKRASGQTGSPLPPSSTQRSSTQKEVSEFAIALHGYYSEKRGVTRRLAPGTAKVIERARNSGFELNDLKLAVDGLLTSEWHRERGQLTLSTIFKTGPGTESFEDRIQGFIDRAVRNQPTGYVAGSVNVPDWIKRSLRVGRENGDDKQARAMSDSAVTWLAQRGLEPTWTADGKLTIARTHDEAA